MLMAQQVILVAVHLTTMEHTVVLKSMIVLIQFAKMVLNVLTVSNLTHVNVPNISQGSTVRF